MDFQILKRLQISARGTATIYRQNQIDILAFGPNNFDFVLQALPYMLYNSDPIIFGIAAATVFYSHAQFQNLMIP
jgi:hypothetical protein